MTASGMWEWTTTNITVGTETCWMCYWCLFLFCDWSWSIKNIPTLILPQVQRLLVETLERERLDKRQQPWISKLHLSKQQCLLGSLQEVQGRSPQLLIQSGLTIRCKDVLFVSSQWCLSSVNHYFPSRRLSFRADLIATHIIPLTLSFQHCHQYRWLWVWIMNIEILICRHGKLLLLTELDRILLWITFQANSWQVHFFVAIYRRRVILINDYQVLAVFISYFVNLFYVLISFLYHMYPGHNMYFDI